MRSIPHLVDGVVIDVNDPQQMGRVKVWIPAVDGKDYDPKNIPWALYTTQVGGSINNYRGGNAATPSGGLTAYGLWTPLKVGAAVVVAFLFGNPNSRAVIACFYPDHRNRSLPVGRNRPDIAQVPVGDNLNPIEPQNGNLQEQFAGNMTRSESKTRGVYERQVGQDKTNKDGTEGYQPNQDPGYSSAVEQNGLDPQTYCWVTPGRHAIIMQDNAQTGRVRIKTSEGHQVIFDDANERIYVSTAKGKTWLELDEDGHIHVYASESISMYAGEDINLTAQRDVNVQAGRNINAVAGKSILASACDEVHVTGDSGIKLTSHANFDIFAEGGLIEEGEVIHLNGPRARHATCPIVPPIIPDHEPWARPATKGERNKNWKA